MKYTAASIFEYRDCDVDGCEAKARWEFSAWSPGTPPRRFFTCEEHRLEGFKRITTEGVGCKR
ncbi:MAG TPA: hypothetical protein VM492_09015 [Sumerlaeia bacterium]|nr:hypothetical protein [Sumerlaeia bacterium]